MSWSADLIELLKTLPNLTALVGDRFIDEMAPQRVVMPYIFVHQKGMEFDDCLAAGDRGDWPDVVNFDLEAWSDNNEEAKQLAEAIRKALHRYGVGVPGGAAMGQSKAQMINVTDQEADYQPRGNSGEAAAYEASLDIDVFPSYTGVA